MKRIKLTALITIFALTITTLSLYTWAKPSEHSNSNSNSNTTAKKIAQLNKDLAAAQKDKVQLEAEITRAIANAIAERNKKLAQLGKTQTTVDTYDNVTLAEIDKMKAADLLEQKRLDSEIAEYQAWKLKYKAGLTEQGVRIDTQTAKTVASLQSKIAAAKDDATKSNYQAQIDSANKTATLRKAAITTYTADLEKVWATRDSIYVLRKQRLLDRQAADLTYRTTLLNIRKVELQDSIANNASAGLKTDEQITQEVNARYADRLAKIIAKIASIQQQLDTLQGTTSPTTTPAPTVTPTATPAPTIEPTAVPTATPAPTVEPTVEPTPSPVPTEAPIDTPTPTP